MYNHEPDNYICPFCLLVKGIENENVFTKQADIIFRDSQITSFIASHWHPNNPGHVIIIPNIHIENIYDLPLDISMKIHAFEKEVAIALKEVYMCDGISTRQNNEPNGNQDVWHYHLHVFPRYKDDNLYGTKKQLTQPEQREIYREKLREYFKNIWSNKL